MYISYQPLWNTLKERGMRKENLRLSAHLTTNMIANMDKGLHIRMEALLCICEALDCDITDVIALWNKRKTLQLKESDKIRIQKVRFI